MYIIYLAATKLPHMTCAEILDELKKMSDPAIKNIFVNHGAPEPLFGVRVGDLKKIQKKVKKNHQLALQLFDSGNSDARYLAGLIADEKQITKDELQHWAQNSGWHMIGEYTVPWIASESKHGYELALEWIEATDESLQASGWSTLASLVMIKQDRELDVPHLKQLLQRVAENIHNAPNRTRYAMNNFVIALGCAVKALTDDAIEAGKKIGKVNVNVGNTACKVPYAPDYIQKAIDKGAVGKKKKMARC